MGSWMNLASRAQPGWWFVHTLGIIIPIDQYLSEHLKHVETTNQIAQRQLEHWFTDRCRLLFFIRQQVTGIILLCASASQVQLLSFEVGMVWLSSSYRADRLMLETNAINNQSTCTLCYRQQFGLLGVLGSPRKAKFDAAKLPYEFSEAALVSRQLPCGDWGQCCIFHT